MRRLLCMILLVACSKAKSDPNPAPAPSAVPSHVQIDPALLASGRIAVGRVERRSPRIEHRFAAEVQAGDGGRAEVGAIVTGRIASLPVVLGQKVEKGTVLARIDAPEVAHAAADLVRARARAEVAKKKLERQLELEAQSATSKNAVDEAKAEATIANADVTAARTLLHQLGGDESGAQAVLKSPIAGAIVERNATLGGAVSPDKTLFVVVGGNAVVVFAKVPETAAFVAAAGDLAEIVGRTAEGNEPRCAVKADGDLGVIDEATRTRPLRLVPTGDCKWAVPGRFVEAVFVRPGSSDATLVVPREAIVQVHGVPVVFVETGPGTFERRAVRLRKGEGPDAIVEDGAAEGTRVVTVGAVLLQGELLRQELGGE